MNLTEAMAAVADAGRRIEILDGRPTITPGGPLKSSVVSVLREHRDEVIVRLSMQGSPLAAAALKAFPGSVRLLSDDEHAELFPKLWNADPRKRATIPAQPLPPDTSGVVQ